jgi:hypothetical protein
MESLWARLQTLTFSSSVLALPDPPLLRGHREQASMSCLPMPRHSREISPVVTA